MASTSGTEVAVGNKFAKRYTILSKLGQGGMGVVYLAQDSNLGDELVAIKILNASSTTSVDDIARFQQEAKVARQVGNETLVRTYDFARARDTYYIVMEYVAGYTLKDCLAQGQTLTISQIIPITVDVLNGLAAVHRVNIIHRDIKPANIILGKNGIARVMDFGIARFNDSKLTKDNQVVGSAAYLAPEAWSKSDNSPAIDIYALGVTIYEVLTACLPFEGNSTAEVMYKHLQEMPQPPHELNPEIPIWLSQIIMRMLNKDPRRRPLPADELAKEINAQWLITLEEMERLAREQELNNLSSVANATKFVGEEQQLENTLLFDAMLTSQPASLLPEKLENKKNPEKVATNQNQLIKKLTVFGLVTLLVISLVSVFFIIGASCINLFWHTAKASGLASPEIWLINLISLQIITLCISIPSFFLFLKKSSLTELVAAVKNSAAIYAGIALVLYVSTSLSKALITTDFSTPNLKSAFVASADTLNLSFQKLLELFLMTPIGLVYELESIDDLTVLSIDANPSLSTTFLHVAIYIIMGLYLIKKIDHRLHKNIAIGRPLIAIFSILAILEILLHNSFPGLLNLSQHINLGRFFDNSLINPQISLMHLVLAPFKWAIVFLVFIKVKTNAS